jgi:hypothetical protein
MCHLFCNVIVSSGNRECVDTYRLRSVVESTGSGITLPPGSPCGKNGAQGYCDPFGKCRSYDGQSSISRLAAKLIDPALKTNIKEWFKVNIN